MLAHQQKIRRWVWTTSIAAVTATGAWYGAGLKTQQQQQQKRKEVREATPEEKIAQLNQLRNGLIAKRDDINRKMAEVEARRSNTGWTDNN